MRRRYVPLRRRAADAACRRRAAPVAGWRPCDRRSVAPGDTFAGHFRIVALIGRGGMGEVYRAEDATLGREVALKVLPSASRHATSLDDSTARFRREAQVLAALNHPNIATIHGLEEADGVRALVLELVDGPTLADRILAGPIPLDGSGPHRQTNRGRPRSGPRAGHRPSRSQARQRQAAAGRDGEVARLRAGKSRSAGCRGERRRDDEPDHHQSVSDSARRHARHRGVRQSRTGQGPRGRSPQRRLGVRGRALRDVVRRAGLQGRRHLGHTRGRAAGRSRLVEAAAVDAAAAAPASVALPRSRRRAAAARHRRGPHRSRRPFLWRTAQSIR